MKIGVLSNHPFALLSINQLLNNKILASLAVPDIPSQHNQNVQLIANSFQIQFKILSKSDLENDLNY